jgi:endonuclease III related protein
MKNASISGIYKILYDSYGPQGWWPIKGQYHPGDYDIPDDDMSRYEVCIGAILTQNTSWNNAQKALENIRRISDISSENISGMSFDEIKNAIRPCGYFRQKTKKIMEYTKAYMRFKDRTPERDELLGIWGIGPETADSILLYAYNGAFFVVDAYTRRLCSRLGLADENAPYNELQCLFQKNLPRDAIIFNEFHALIVEHSKRHCRKKPKCMGCHLTKTCKSIIIES